MDGAGSLRSAPPSVRRPPRYGRAGRAPSPAGLRATPGTSGGWDRRVRTRPARRVAARRGGGHLGDAVERDRGAHGHRPARLDDGIAGRAGPSLVVGEDDRDREPRDTGVGELLAQQPLELACDFRRRPPARRFLPEPASRARRFPACRRNRLQAAPRTARPATARWPTDRHYASRTGVQRMFRAARASRPCRSAAAGRSRREVRAWNSRSRSPTSGWCSSLVPEMQLATGCLPHSAANSWLLTHSSPTSSASAGRRGSARRQPQRGDRARGLARPVAVELARVRVEEEHPREVGPSGGRSGAATSWCPRAGGGRARSRPAPRCGGRARRRARRASRRRGGRVLAGGLSRAAGARARRRSRGRRGRCRCARSSSSSCSARASASITDAEALVLWPCSSRV